ncbi:MAG: LpxI family protein [Alphaproteobacteria bacterium]|nr:LpxI family protein [Alphaproteobacteria bacterium]
MTAILGIIAGGGEAPKRLIAACLRMNRPFHVLALEGQSDADIAGDDVPVTWLPLGAASAALALAKEKKITDVVMVGRVRRPSIAELKPDWLMLQKLARIGLGALGDDGLLKAIAKEFEAEGFNVLAPQDVFADLILPAGQLGKHAPSDIAQADITRGIEIARALGALDVGQSVVVQQGIVLGVEAIEGTDALIGRTRMLKREGAGPVLVKLKKPQQDMRFDLPALGIETVREALAAGFSGIAAEAGGTLLIDREDVIKHADASGLFIIGLAL